MNFRIINIYLVNKDEKPNLQIIKDVDDLLVCEYMPITTGFEVHCTNNFLRSLNTELEIKFESYSQYNKLIKKINNNLGGF